MMLLGKLLGRILLDLTLAVLIGAAIFTTCLYLSYRNWIPDGASPNGGQLVLWRAVEALGLEVPELREAQEQFIHSHSFRGAPADLPADDRALEKWLRSRPGVDGVRLARKVESDGRVLIDVRFRRSRRLKELKLPWRELGYGRKEYHSFTSSPQRMTGFMPDQAQLRLWMVMALLVGLVSVELWHAWRWGWRRIRGQADSVRGHWPLLAVVAAVYTTAFFLPAALIVVLDAATDRVVSAFPLTGAQAFGEALRLYHDSWYANPLLWAGFLLLLLRLQGWAGLAATAALVLGLHECVRSSLGHFGHSYYAGYWLWLASMALLAVGSLVMWGKAVRQGLSRPSEHPA